jgi:hypothetical protein
MPFMDHRLTLRTAAAAVAGLGAELPPEEYPRRIAEATGVSQQLAEIWLRNLWNRIRMVSNQIDADDVNHFMAYRADFEELPDMVALKLGFHDVESLRIILDGPLALVRTQIQNAMAEAFSRAHALNND